MLHPAEFYSCIANGHKFALPSSSNSPKSQFPAKSSNSTIDFIKFILAFKKSYSHIIILLALEKALPALRVQPSDDSRILILYRILFNRTTSKLDTLYPCQYIFILSPCAIPPNTENGTHFTFVFGRQMDFALKQLSFKMLFIITTQMLFCSMTHTLFKNKKLRLRNCENFNVQSIIVVVLSLWAALQFM